MSPVDYEGGSTTGRPAPASIQVELENGSTVTAPLKGQPVFGVATYALPGSSPRPTGEATAEVDFTWAAGDSFFLRAGPCADTVAEIEADPVVVGGGTITVSGRITLANGTPVAGTTVPVRHWAPSTIGTGDYTLVETGADGRFSVEYPNAELGLWTFAIEYVGSGAFEDALDGASDAIDVFVVPGTPPASSGDGELSSSAGSSSHVTTVSGSGFDPESTVVLVVYSQPVHLATVKTDAEGKFSAQISIPTTLTGAHTVVAIGRSEGETRQLVLGVNLPALAKTGTSLTLFIGVGGALVMLGALLWWVARRRRATA